MVVLDLFDGDVTFLLERSVQTVVECNTNVILKSQFVLGEIFWHHSANSLTYMKIIPFSTSLHFFAFGFIPHIFEIVSDYSVFDVGEALRLFVFIYFFSRYIYFQIIGMVLHQIKTY